MVSFMIQIMRVSDRPSCLDVLATMVIVVIQWHALHRILWNPVLVVPVLMWQELALVRPGTQSDTVSLCR